VAADRRRYAEGLDLDRHPAGVLLDSNFLFIPLRFGVDIFDELRRLLGENVKCLVTRPVLTELDLLRRGAKPGFLKEIGFARKMAEKCDVFEDSLRIGETVDQSLVRVAIEQGFNVATNDAELRKTLKKASVSVVFLRQRAFLEVDGVIR
jgi:rRNA-processing protein FCF1